MASIAGFAKWNFFKIQDKSPFAESVIVFSPTVESVQSPDAMFTENPRVLMEQGKFQNIPLVMGVTSGEGGLRTARKKISKKRP